MAATNDSKESRLVAGAMSGTSADGVDVALVHIQGRGLDMKAKLVRHHHRPYDACLKNAIMSMRNAGSARLKDLARLARDISLVYAAAVNEMLLSARMSADQLVAVACHGQTLYHDPPATIQWLDPALVAEEVGAVVISDFRRADCAVGGQGAPLVPFADWVLFRHPEKSRVLLNIGGVANLTFLPAGGALADVIAFDTGPGNCISDWLMRSAEPQGPGFDRDGARAGMGLLEGIGMRMLEAAWFARRPPKSTDGPAMIALWQETLQSTARDASRSELDDLLAEACFVTALSVNDALARFLPRYPDEIFVSGGGAKNESMMWMLNNALEGHGVSLRPLDELGVPAEAKEAMAFALMGAATLDGVPANVPSATGASRAVVLGAITPRP